MNNAINKTGWQLLIAGAHLSRHPPNFDWFHFFHISAINQMAKGVGAVFHLYEKRLSISIHFDRRIIF